MTRICSIDLHSPDKAVYSGHLRMGGHDRLGNTLDLTNYYLRWNGRGWRAAPNFKARSNWR